MFHELQAVGGFITSRLCYLINILKERKETHKDTRIRQTPEPNGRQDQRDIYTWVRNQSKEVMSNKISLGHLQRNSGWQNFLAGVDLVSHLSVLWVCSWLYAQGTVCSDRDQTSIGHVQGKRLTDCAAISLTQSLWLLIVTFCHLL